MVGTTRRHLLASSALLLAAGSGCTGLFDGGDDGSTTHESTPTRETKWTPTDAEPTQTPRQDPDPGEVVWENDAVGSYPRAPTYHRGRVFVGDLDGVLWSIDGATGNTEWSVELGEDLRVSPAGHEDQVFAGPVEGDLSARDARTGDELMTVSMPRSEHFTNPPGVINGLATDAERVYVPVSNSGTFLAIDAVDGGVVWSIAGKGTFNTPVVIDGTLYVTNIGYEVFSLDPETGEKHWTHEVDHNVQNCTPSVTDDVVAVTTTDGRIRALDRESGEVLWREQPSDRLDDVAASHGRVLAGDGDGGLVALDATTGTVDWSADFKHEVRDAATVLGDTAYVPTYSNEVVACDIDSGEVLWEADVESRIRFELATDGTYLYASHTSGGVAAIAR